MLLPPEKSSCTLKILIFQALSEARRKRLAGRQNDELPKPAKWLFSTISGILSYKKGGRSCDRNSLPITEQMDHKTKDGCYLPDAGPAGRLEQNYETLIEQIRLANQQRFGRQTEKLDDIAGQLSFFNEAEANYDETAPEPVMEEVIESAEKRPVNLRKKGQREEDLKDFPQEEISHDIPEQELNEAFGSGNWKSMPDEIFWQAPVRAGQMDCGETCRKSVCRNRWGASG